MNIENLIKHCDRYKELKSTYDELGEQIEVKQKKQDDILNELSSVQSLLEGLCNADKKAETHHEVTEDNLLDKFLKAKGVYGEFVENMINYDLYGNTDYLYKSCEQLSLSVAFSWMETEQGYDYWDNLNEEFIKYLNINK